MSMRTSRYLAAAALIAAICSSCQTTLDENTPQMGDRAIIKTFKASYGYPTKVFLMDKTHFGWEKNDMIGVYEPTYEYEDEAGNIWHGFDPVEFDLKSLDNNTATFQGELTAEQDSYMAVYPFNPDCVYSEGENQFMIWKSSDQNLDPETGVDRNALMLIGRGQDNLTFESPLALIHFSLGNEYIRSLKFEFGGCYVWDCNWYMDADSYKVKVDDECGLNELYVYSYGLDGEPHLFSTAKDYWISVPAMTMQGFKVTAYDQWDNEIGSIESAVSKQLQSNTDYSLGKLYFGVETRKVTECNTLVNELEEHSIVTSDELSNAEVQLQEAFALGKEFGQELGIFVKNIDDSDEAAVAKMNSLIKSGYEIDAVLGTLRDLFNDTVYRKDSVMQQIQAFVNYVEGCKLEGNEIPLYVYEELCSECKILHDELYDIQTTIASLSYDLDRLVPRISELIRQISDN